MSLSFDHALDKALQWLRSSDKFSWEIEAKLVQAGAETSIAHSVVNHLVELLLVRDEALAQRIAEKDLQEKKRGPIVATQRLMERGMEPGMAENIVAEVLGATDLVTQATKLIENRRTKLDSPAKAARFLAARGFTEEVIASVLDATYNL